MSGLPSHRSEQAVLCRRVGRDHNLWSDQTRATPYVGHLWQEQRDNRFDDFWVELAVGADRNREIPRVHELINRRACDRLTDGPLETRRRHGTSIDRTRRVKRL